MKNMFNKANAPYIVSSTLAIATLLASGVFAAAPYVGFLAPVVALGVGLPFIIGAAVFSAVVIAFSAVAIGRNNTISQQERFESRVAQRKQEEKNARAELKIPDTIELPCKLISVPDTIALPDKDGQGWVAAAKEKAYNWIPSLKTVESIAKVAGTAGVLYAVGKSSPGLFESRVAQRKQEEKNAIEELNIPKAIPLPYKSVFPHTIALPDKDGQGWVAAAKEKAYNWIPSLKTVESIAKVAGTAGVLYAVGKSSPGLVDNPISNIGSNNLTSNSSSGHPLFPNHAPGFSPVTQQEKINEYYSKFKNAQKFAKGGFVIPQDYSEPQWVKDLNKSETLEEIIDAGALSTLFYEGSNSDYQFAEPNVTHAESSKTVGSNQTAMARYSDVDTSAAENTFMSTYGSFLRNLNPFSSREHSVNNVPSLLEEVDSTRLLVQPVLVTAY